MSSRSIAGVPGAAGSGPGRFACLAARAMRAPGRAFLILAFCLPALRPASAECPDLTSAFDAAIKAQNLAGASEAENKIAREAACGSRALVDAQRRRAALQISMSEELKSRPGSAARREALIVDAEKPEVLWLASYVLGELRMEQRRFANAAEAFQRAIEIVKNPDRTPTAPPTADIQYLIDRASEARMLAANEEGTGQPAIFVTAAKDHRDGSVGGSLSANVRGVVAKSIPLPINFDTGVAQLTRIGQQAADELLAALKEQRPDRILLVGHTDERGGDAYNMRLSQARVDTIARFLKDNGVTARIEVQARGKREPLKIRDTAGLSQQDVWALNRRVEWRRE